MLQCRNVSNAVHRNYTVIYGPAGENAWEAGRLCKDVGDLCTDVDVPIKHAGNCAVSGLAFVMLGQVCLLVYSMRLNMSAVLWTSEASFAVAWVLLLASWATFANLTSQEATCIVESESRQGAVIASGTFGDIINGRGSYTFGFVIGAWLVLSATISVVGARLWCIVKGDGKEQVSMPETVVSEPKVAKQTDMDEI